MADGVATRANALGRNGVLDVSTAQRPAIVLKLSGEALAVGGRPLSPFAFEAVAAEIVDLVRAGYRVGVVVGGGNIHRGGTPWGAHGLSRQAADVLGMHATALNAIALGLQLDEAAGDLRTSVIAKRGPVKKLFARWTGLRLGRYATHDVLIVAGGIGRSGVSTDVAAPLLARDMGADRVVMSKFKVDGIYSLDPRHFPLEAQLLPTLSVDEALARDLRFMDQSAMRLCQKFGLTVHVLSAERRSAITELLLGGARLGSIMEPRGVSVPSQVPPATAEPRTQGADAP